MTVVYTPVGTIQPQVEGTDVLADCPVVLVDSALYTVDDPRACVGSVTVITPLKPVAVVTTKPRGK